MHIGIKKLSLYLGLIVCLFGSIATTHAEVRLPHGEFLDATEDLKVKVLGGFVSMTRTWDKGQWHFNPVWSQLKFTYDSLDGSVKSIDRVGAEYKKTTPGTFVLDARSFIKATATGYRWQDKTGNSIDYNAQGVIQSYSDRNDIKVNFQYDAAGKRTGVFDHYGNQVLWYEYTADQLTAIRDATNRRVTYGYTGNDLTTVVDVLNNTWRYAYLSPTKLSVRTDPENRTLTLTYDGGGRVASAKDRDNIGYTYEYDYDANKREYFVRQRTSGGKITETWYDAQSNVIRKDINAKTTLSLNTDTAARATSITDARGLTTTVTRDQWDNEIKTVYPDGATATATYDPQYSNPLTKADEKGTITKYEYDAKGNLTRLTEALNLPEQRVIEYSYDQYGQRKTENRKGNPSTNTADAITQFDYDPNGNLIQITDAENHITRYPTQDYDVQGNSKKKIDARGKVWTRTYDNKGHVLTITDPLNHTTTFAYDNTGYKSRLTDAVGNVTQYSYDGRGNLVTVTDPYGAVTRYDYNDENQRIKVTDPENRIQTTEYYLDGRTSKRTDGNGNIVQYLFGDEESGLDNLLIKIVYPTYSQEYKYDNRNRIVQSILVLNATSRQTSTYTYDNTGNVLSIIDADSRTTRLTYDSLRRITDVTDHLNGRTSNSFDVRNNILVVSDPKGNTHRFEYDRLNRKVKEVLPLGQTSVYSYDEVGNLASVTDAKGQHRKYFYDDSNRFSSESHFLIQTDTSPVKTVSYIYNDLNRITEFSDGTSSTTRIFDSRGLRKLGETVNYGTFTLGYSNTYYANGLKKSFTGPDSVMASYSYDRSNQLETILLPSGSITVNSYRWKAPSQITFPGGTVRTEHHDPLMRLAQIQVKDPGQSELMNYQYGYDNAYNIKTKATEHGLYSYSYDDLNRLTQVQNPGPLPAETYTYDPAGNRLTDTKTTQAWSYNANNQLIGFDGISFDYDANGNTIKKTDANDPAQVRFYVYDTSNRLVEVRDQNHALISRYTYDPFGRRLSKETTGNNATKIYFLYGDEGLIAEADSSGIVTKIYGYKPGSTRNTDPVYLRQGSNTYYYQNDHLGTPQKLLAQNGSIVWSVKTDSFGHAVVDSGSTVTNNLGFPGQYYDSESGLFYNGWRYYDPKSGRYVTSDPIGLKGGVNIYAYALANPVNNFDPMGLDTDGLYGCIFMGEEGNHPDTDYYVKDFWEIEVWPAVPKPTSYGEPNCNIGRFMPPICRGRHCVWPPGSTPPCLPDVTLEWWQLIIKTSDIWKKTTESYFDHYVCLDKCGQSEERVPNQRTLEDSHYSYLTDSFWRQVSGPFP